MSNSSISLEYPERDVAVRHDADRAARMRLTPVFVDAPPPRLRVAIDQRRTRKFL